MNIRCIIIAAAVVLAFLVVIVNPVAAYSVSIGQVSKPSGLPASMLSRLSSYQSSTPSGLYALIQSSNSGTIGTQGSVTAYSSLISLGDPSIRFSESVKVNGLIRNFHYSAHFDSGFSNP